MSQGPQLEQSLRQTQQLSVQQLQYLRLLQMNTTELNTYLNDLQLENPLLDVVPAVPEEGVAPAPTPAELAAWMTTDTGVPGRPAAEDEPPPSYEELQADTRDRYSLEEYLKNQIDLSVDGEEYRMLDWLIGHIDRNGYLTVDAQALAAEFGCDVSLAREAIGYLQTLDPPGIGAADLAECLQIQLMRMGVYGDDAMALCRDWLEDLAHGRFQKAAKALGVPVNRVNAIYSIIRTLNPRPASAFGGDPAAAVLPDVTVLETPEGLSCACNRRGTASVSVNRSYLELEGQDEDAKEYLNRKLSQAMWVVRAVQSRQETIERIVGVILEEQADFFTRDDGELRPLRRRDVAERLGVHESTVSRAINEKYLQCRKGVYPLRYFFPAAVGEGSVAASNRTAQDRIRALIDGEDPCHPLSDSAIARALAGQGLPIARRTVAKYREEMHIPSSATRRR